MKNSIYLIKRILHQTKMMCHVTEILSHTLRLERVMCYNVPAVFSPQACGVLSLSHRAGERTYLLKISDEFEIFSR